VRLYCIRHGESAWNEEQRIQGQADIGLTPRGRAQAAALAERLAHLPIGAVLSSDLRRAVETAQPIAARHGLIPQLVPALRERHFGIYQGLTFEEVAARDPFGWEAIFAGDGCPPGGERRAEVLARVERFLEALRAAPPAEHVVVVGHGGSIRALVLALLGLPLAAAWQLRVDNGGVTVFACYPEGAILETFNDTCHLPEEER
jgi:broad specificity phosphatase PhoE